jgi:hypothetical protein
VRALVVLAVLALGAARADAATFCVDASAPECVDRPSVAAALAAAADEPGTDTIRIGRRTEAGTFADARGEAVRIVGAGRTATVLEGTLDFGQGESSVAELAVRATGATALALRGDGDGLRVDGGVRLRDGAALRSSVITGSVTTAGETAAHSVLIAGAGVDVESGALTARHLTVYGSGAVGVRIAPRAAATVADSIVWGFASAFSGAFVAPHSDYPGALGAVDPGFVDAPTDLGLGARSPLVDAGDPEPLDGAEPLEDAAGAVRAVDGNGNGTARRDVGALERRPPPPPGTRRNLLANAGAEQGTAATNDTASPAPPRWTRTGTFTSVRYGTVAGPFAFPPIAAAKVLRGGDAFFAGGPGGAASLTQVVDVSRWAPEIDAREGARVRLSALLGGFRQSEDHGTVSAEFRGPTGARRDGFALDTVTAAERANATMLAARTAERPIPRLTRTIAVTLRAGAPGGSYNDAYADNIALVPRVPRLPGLPRPGAGRRPFAGLSVLSRRVRVDRHGRARVRLGCATATVGTCGGVVTLTRMRSAVLGSLRVALQPGRVRRVRIPLSRRARRSLVHRRTGGHVYAAARDGQGRTRSTVAPVRIVRRR